MRLLSYQNPQRRANKWQMTEFKGSTFGRDVSVVSSQSVVLFWYVLGVASHAFH